MKNKKNTIMLVVIIISLIILTWNKSYSYEMKDNIPEETEVERKEFGIYLQESGESYKETNTFPDTGYLLNEDKTKCYEYGSDKEVEKAVEQSLTKGVIDGTIIVQSTKSMYCKIYFDKDEKPTVNSFNITGKTSSGDSLSNGFTYDKGIYTISWNDGDVAQYCLSTSSTTCNGTWTLTNGVKTITIENNTFTSTEGPKTIYAYIKDKANNISESLTNQITVDRTKPVISTFALTGTSESPFTVAEGYTHTTTVNYNATITETNIEGYCIQEGNSCNTYTSSPTTNGSITIGTNEGEHTVTISVKDKAGNVGSKSETIKYDSVDPTILLSQKNITENTIVVTVTVADTGSGIKNVTCTAVGNNETKAGTYSSTAKTCTFSGLKDGTQYTITGEATDNSGRKGTSSQIKVTTKSAGFSPTELLSGEKSPKGLSTKLLGGMYRFVGACNVGDGDGYGCDGKVDNFVCFGYNDSKTDCVKNSENGVNLDNDYIYRIIGITEDGQMKLIKNTAIREGSNNFYRWYKNYTEDITWPKSDIYKRLNGQMNGTVQGYNNGNTNLFINSTTSNVQYIKSSGTEEETKWYNKIENHEWKYGDTTNINTDADRVYSIESGFSDHIQAKVGLMYVSDYYYSYATDGSDSSYTNCNSNPSCKNSWMHISQNGKSDDYQHEWTMTRYGRYSNGSYRAWNMSSDGGVYNGDGLYRDYSVRPVFYLNSDVVISGGAGTSGSPFIIKK